MSKSRRFFRHKNTSQQIQDLCKRLLLKYYFGIYTTKVGLSYTAYLFQRFWGDAWSAHLFPFFTQLLPPLQSMLLTVRFTLLRSLLQSVISLFWTNIKDFTVKRAEKWDVKTNSWTTCWSRTHWHTSTADRCCQDSLLWGKLPVTLPPKFYLHRWAVSLSHARRGWLVLFTLVVPAHKLWQEELLFLKPRETCNCGEELQQIQDQ